MSHSESIDINLPSGSKLKITVSPFVTARALYQAILEEAKNLKLDPNAEIDVNLRKDLFCLALSSQKIQVCLDKCMERVTYNGIKISADTFEPVAARDDYLLACFEVAKANISPFMKSLFAQFAPFLGSLGKAQA